MITTVRVIGGGPRNRKKGGDESPTTTTARAFGGSPSNRVNRQDFVDRPEIEQALREGRSESSGRLAIAISPIRPRDCERHERDAARAHGERRSRFPLSAREIVSVTRGTPRELRAIGNREARWESEGSKRAAECVGGGRAQQVARTMSMEHHLRR
jgi:hypothetical protein